MSNQENQPLGHVASSLLPRFFFWKMAALSTLTVLSVVGGVWFVLDIGLRGMEVAISGQNERIGAIEASNSEGRAELNSRISSQSATIDGRFNALDGRLVTFDERFDRLLNQNSQILAEIGVLGEKVSNLTDAVRESGYVVPTLPDTTQGLNSFIYAYYSNGLGRDSLSAEEKERLLSAFAGRWRVFDENGVAVIFDEPGVLTGRDYSFTQFIGIEDFKALQDSQLDPNIVVSWDRSVGEPTRDVLEDLILHGAFVPANSVGLPQEWGEILVVAVPSDQ